MSFADEARRHFAEAVVLFEPFQIKDVTFSNRILRSSMGGRVCYHDGTVSPAWTHFERTFAEHGVAGIISPTISVNEARMSPLEYPSLHDDRFVEPLREAVRTIRAGSRSPEPCKYIVQLGDTGGHTHTGILPQDADRVSASAYFDFLFGYQNTARAMSLSEIEQTIDDFVNAAGRVVAAGCDGLEITASKGYLIHQYLNPATNRRTDAYGGSVEKRFRLLAEIVEAVRKRIGPDFLFGVRLSARDSNYLPFNIRIPLSWPPPSLSDYVRGNGLAETTYYARELERLGIDYLHIDSGFGFPNPHGSPGDFPDEGFLTFVNATRYLSTKAAARATVFNVVPSAVRKRVFGLGWHFRPAANAELASAIRRAVSIPVIANGGFQDRDVIDGTLAAGKCDLIAIARPLLANPDLLAQFAAGAKRPANPCSYCTLCCSQTAVLPLGCYDQRRFETPEAMLHQVLAWSSPNTPFSIADGARSNADSMAA